MASPGYTNGSPASRRSTPSRNTPNGTRRVNGFHSPFRNSLHGSPSQQILEEHGRLHASKERSLKRSLDEQTTEQAAKHFKALDDGLRKHERVRQSAERTLQQVVLENELEARKEAELEAQKVEQARRALEQQKAAEQRRRIEAERAQEQAAAREQEELRRQQELDAQKRAAEQQQRERQETERRQQEKKRQTEESDRKARAEAEAKEREAQELREREATARASQSVGGYPPGFVTPVSEVEQTHQRYLELHQRLKKMRNQVAEQVKALGKDQKEQLREWRTGINRAIGMLRKADDDKTKASNRERLKEVTGFLDQAARTTQPMMDITPFFVEDPPPPDAPKEGPAQLLFLLNHFAKSIVRQIVAEASLDPPIANAIGIAAVTVFARPTYAFHGRPMIDLLWAKFHRQCPALFGITGNEQTAQGRQRMGWVHNNEMMTPDNFYLSQRGLALGYANITLRKFTNVTSRNPAPNRLFWQALARLLNVPVGQAQPTHFELLKFIAEHATSKFVQLFGAPAKILIRQAVTTFPAKHESGAQTPTAKSTLTALKSLPHVLRQKYPELEF